MKNKISSILYKLFGGLLFTHKSRRRLKDYKRMEREKYSLEVAFGELESKLSDIEYPNNDFNKIMSMISSDIRLFHHVAQRFRRDRKILSYISKDDHFLRLLKPNQKSYPSHPHERENNQAIRIDVQSLFIFGMILVNRSLLLLKMYLPDKGENMYSKIGNFYFGLSGASKLSDISTKFRDLLLVKIKWLYSALRFYRNEFIEHLDKGYQQGMNFGLYQDDFILSSYKYNYSESDNEEIEKFRNELEGAGVKIAGRSDGGRSIINRYYIQRLFENIDMVPDDLLKRSLEIIEEIGANSPQPEVVIANVEEYVEGILKFMKEELNNSELAKYQKNSASR